MDQINKSIIDTHCLIWGSETLPDTLNNKNLFLYTTLSKIQAGLSNM